MTIWIVTKNGKVDSVFDNLDAAMNHRKNLTKGWNLTEIVERELYSI